MSLKAIYLAPGRLIAEIQYLFPKEGQIFASARRRESPLAIAIYATLAWGAGLFLVLSLLANHRPQDKQPPASATQQPSRVVSNQAATLPVAALPAAPPASATPYSYTPPSPDPRPEVDDPHASSFDLRLASDTADQLLAAARFNDETTLVAMADRYAADLPAARPPVQAAIDANAEGLALVGKQLYRIATAEFSRAAELSPDFAEAWQNLAFASLRSDDLDRAEAAAKTSLALGPVDSNNWVILSEILARQGSADNAVAGFRAVVTFARNKDATIRFLEKLAAESDSAQVAAAIRANLSGKAESSVAMEPDKSVSSSDVAAARAEAARADGDRAVELRFEARLPEAAAGVARSGVVKIRATIAPNGYVTYCDVLSEEPTGLGFSDAACHALYTWKFEEGAKSTQQVLTIKVGGP